MPFIKRLEDALAKAGKKKADLARHLNIRTQAISGWSKGSLPDPKRWQEIASFVGLGIEELFGGTKAMEPSRVSLKVGRLDGDRINIPEYDITPHAGAGASLGGMSVEGDQPLILAEWSLPRQVIDAAVDHPGGLAILKVTGDSMEPDYHAGDRVMVDTAHRTPSPPGVYVLWDGMGIVLKRLEIVPSSEEPITVRLSSINPGYGVYERPLDEVHINGRVVGKWVWK